MNRTASPQSNPSGWRAGRLRHLGRFFGGGTPSKENPQFWHGTIPWVSPKDMKSMEISDSEDHISPEAVRQSATRMVPSQSLLMVVRSGILQRTIPVGINTRPVALNQDLKAFVPSPEIDARFLMFYVLGEEHRLLAEWRKEGATVESLEMDLVQDTAVSFPSATRQRSIAAFLDRKAAAIDDLIAKKERLIDLLQEKRQALITQAVTKGLDPKVPMKESGILWLGRIPAHWTTMRLSRLLTESPRNGISPVVAGDGTTPSFSIAAMRGGTVKIGENIKYVSLEESVARPYHVRVGDVFVMRGSGSLELAGTAGLVEEEPPEGCTYPDTLIRLRLGKKVRRVFAVAALNSRPVRAQMETAMRTAAGIWKISGDRLSAIQVPVPPTSEQLDIETAIREASSRLATMTARVEAQVEHLREYRQALISAAVTGKIEIPSEEAA